MFDLPPHRDPTAFDLLLIGVAGLLASILAWARQSMDGKLRPLAARLAIIVAGGVFGMIVGAILLAYSVPPLLVVAVSAFVGSAGEYAVQALAKIGIAAADDPWAMVERVTGRSKPPPQPEPPEPDSKADG